MGQLKVAFNILPLESGHEFRGYGYYAKNLLAELKKQDINIQEFKNLDEVRNVDLVHYPFFDLFNLSLPINKRFPTIVTIADVIPLIFPNHYPPGIRGKIKNKIQRLSLKNVDFVITISKTSKEDIKRYLNISSSKIFPIYLGVSKKFKMVTDRSKLETVGEKYKLPKRFALFVGNVNWNKNLLNLTEAGLRAELDICLVGKSFEERNNLTHHELKTFKQFLDKYSNNPKVRILGFVPDEDIVAVYNLAEIFLFPSFYEGFGLPILEAQACGVPVVTSNTSSMPEVGGKAAVYVNPYSVDDIVSGIREVEKTRDKLIKVGFENVKRFSWEKTAAETIKVYKGVITTNIRS